MNYGYGECCCPTHYGEAFVVLGGALRRMSISQHSDYDQSVVSDLWSVPIPSAETPSGGTESTAPDPTNTAAQTRLSETGETVWIISENPEYVCTIDVSDIASPTVTGCWTRENDVGGTTVDPYFVPWQTPAPGVPVMGGMLMQDCGVSFRASFGDDWFVTSDRREQGGGGLNSFWHPPDIFFVNPSEFAWSQDAKLDYSGTGWVPMGISRSVWPAKVVAARTTITSDNLTVEIGHATLPSSAPMSYPSAQSPSFTTFFSRAYTNVETDTTPPSIGLPSPKAETTTAMRTVALMTCIADFDWDPHNDEVVYSIFAADDADMDKDTLQLADLVWKNNYSHSVGGSTTNVVDQPAEDIYQGTGGNEDVVYANAASVLQIIPDGLGNRLSVSHGGSAYKNDTVFTTSFVSDLSYVAHGGVTGDFLLSERSRITTLNYSGSRTSFAPCRAAPEGEVAAARMYRNININVVPTSDLTTTPEWGHGVPEELNGGDLYYSVQMGWDNPNGPDEYRMPAYQAGSVLSYEMFVSSPFNGFAQPLYSSPADVSTISGDPYIPDHEHVRQGG